MRRDRYEVYEDREIFSPWETYSDLYCGLLLVFVLLFFFAIYQYIDARETNDADTLALQTSMKEEQEAVLALYKADLADQEAAYREKNEALAAEREKLAILQGDLSERETELEQQKALVSQQESELAAQDALLETRESELASQQTLLAESRSELEEQRTLLAENQSELEEQRTLLAESRSELEAQQTLLAEKESELQTQGETLAKREAQIAAQNEKLNTLQGRIEEQQEQLEQQAGRIEQIIGVRGELISALRESMAQSGLQAEVDTDTGAIAFASEILFAFDSAQLKEEGKAFFEEFMPVYLSVLLQPEFEPYIAEIMIEGHTDSAGTYLHNLELSQQRAYSVAAYIIGEESALDERTVGKLKGLVSVNGCADRSPVYDEDGNVDEERSRRVEIKFRLKDQEMIRELDDILR